MIISITGQTGFVGQNLTNYFRANGYLLLNLPRNFLNDLAVSTMKDSDVIIHLAGKAHDLKNHSNPWSYFEVNTLMTQRVFDIFLQSKASVFIFFSSVKAVADQIDGVLTEDAEPNPKTDYGKSKFWAEEYIKSKCPPSKRVYILRPCLIYGHGNKGNLKLLFSLINKNIPWPLGKFQNLRSVISIHNVCFILNEIIQNKNIPSGIYNLSDDDPISTNEIFSIISSAINKKPIILKTPPIVIKFFAVIGDLLNLPFRSEKLNKLTENYIVSNKKITRAIKKRLPIRASEGLFDTFK